MEQPPDKVVIQGFMLKKKRKALQGYARRYFRLSESGSLSYSFNPNSPIRDSISVPLAFISASRKLRTLDIDGGNCVYHCKCLSLDDFDKWATALKAFINIAQNHRGNDQNVHAVGRQTLLANSPPAPAPAVPADQLDRVYAALAKLSQPICDLELVAHELGQKPTHTTVLSTSPSPSSAAQVTPSASPSVPAPAPATPSSTASSSFPAAAPSPTTTTTTTTTNAVPPPSSNTSGTTLASSSSNSGGGNGGGSSKFRFLGKRSNSTSLHLHPHHHATSAPPPPPPPPVPLHSPGGVVRSPTLMSSSTLTSASASATPAHHQPRQPERSNSTATTASSHSHSHSNPAHEPDSWARQQLNEAISVLKTTHAALIAAVQALPLVVVPSPQSQPQPQPHPQPGTQTPQVVSPKEQLSSSIPPLQTTDLDPARSGGGIGGASSPYSSSYNPSYPYPDSTSSASPPGSPTGALNRSFAYQRTLGHTRNAPSRATTIASSSRASFVSAVEWSPPPPAETAAGAGSEYWYDAVPVPGEFVLDDDDEKEEDGDAKGAGGRRRRRRRSSSSSPPPRPEASSLSPSGPDHPDGEDDERAAPSERREPSSSSESLNTVTRSDNEDDNEEEEEAVETNIVAEDEDEDSGDDDDAAADGAAAAADSSSVYLPSSPAATEAGTEPATTYAAAEAVVAVQRRKVLPHPVAGDEFSMLGMLRKNVGKDLSTISFPVTMNEPLSALQRLAEEIEYSDLLDRAAAAPKGSLERLMFVAVFAVSGAAGNKYRSSRKPFNPLLGETYECIRPERGFRFVSEKVSHHPPVLAFHTEATSRGWQLSGHVAPNQKFWGRSMEIFVLGDCSVRFLDDDDEEEYSIRKPSSFVKNLVAGTKYIEIVGDLVVSCLNSKAHAVVSFKEGSSWGGVSTRNKIEGRVVDERGVTRIELVGRWDDAVDRKDGKHSFTRLWQIADSPPNPERYYGFSYFATTLNETTPLEAGLMAPTDSRLRPDQLALERGDVDEAERLKQVVEEKQRSKRKSGKAPEPKWFTRRKEEGGGGTTGTGTGGAWSYAGGYFETREKKAFEDPDIF